MTDDPLAASSMIFPLIVAPSAATPEISTSAAKVVVKGVERVTSAYDLE
jgi:hypothetical protein